MKLLIETKLNAKENEKATYGNVKSHYIDKNFLIISHTNGHKRFIRVQTILSIVEMD